MTLCISSQAGCALQCAFCATGAMGFTRNLQMFEIAGQVREMKLLSPPMQVTNVVFMGMGEPLMNWRAVDPALTVLNSPSGLGIGARHITVSTVGVLPGIVALGPEREGARVDEVGDTVTVAVAVGAVDAGQPGGPAPAVGQGVDEEGDDSEHEQPVP